MAREVYVFIQLPQTTASVVAGRFTLEESLEPRVGRFVYARSYLERQAAVPLDPVALPLREQEFVTTANGGYFGVLRDAMPDAWGRHVVAALGLARIESDFDYLLLPSRDRVGALRFGTGPAEPLPDEPVARSDAITRVLISGLRKIADEQTLTTAERDAVVAGGVATTAGGARPKLTLEDGGALWLVKLARSDDKWNHARAEAAMLDLAGDCGIEVPEHHVQKIAGRDVLFVKRFDRALIAEGVARHRVASAATLFCADESHDRPSLQGSYPRIARELERWVTNVTAQRRELFNRVAFNCLTGVTDDHERNHSLVAPDTHFRLAPAYDLNPTIPTTRRRFQGLVVGALGAHATRENLLSSINAFGLDRGEATVEIDRIAAAVRKNWRSFMKRRGLTAAVIERFAPGFATDFFESAAGESASSLAMPVPVRRTTRRSR